MQTLFISDGVIMWGERNSNSAQLGKSFLVSKNDYHSAEMVTSGESCHAPKGQQAFPMEDFSIFKKLFTMNTFKHTEMFHKTLSIYP